MRLKISNKVVLYPDPILKRHCSPFVDINDIDISNIAQQMFKIMHDNKGVGLSGPQVGLSKRIFVCNHTGNPDDNQLWVNPIIEMFNVQSVDVEGCLSIPGVKVLISRSVELTISGFGVGGKTKTMIATGLLARIIQHEIDHLNGILITNHMSPTDQIINRGAIKVLNFCGGIITNNELILKNLFVPSCIDVEELSKKIIDKFLECIITSTVGHRRLYFKNQYIKEECIKLDICINKKMKTH